MITLRERSTFLSQFDESSLKDLAEVLSEVHCAADERLIRAGDRGDRAFILVDGRLISEDSENPTLVGAHRELSPGDLVGEAAFATGDRNQKQVRALEPTRLFEITRTSFNRLLHSSPQAWKKLEELLLHQVRSLHLDQIIDNLFGPFEQLLPYVMQDIHEEIEWLTLKSGETLYSHGDDADGVYILLTGRLQVTQAKSEDEEEIVATIVDGEVIGEVALLTGQNRAETVYAIRDSDLARLSKRGFGKMLGRNIWAVNRISRNLAQRILKQRQPRDAERMPIRTISLIPASASAPVDELVPPLQDVLARYGPVEVLDRESVDAALDMPGISQAKESDPAHLRLMQWLQEKEEASRYLLYVGDRSWTPWTERSVRQADNLVVVADATAAPDLSQLQDGLSLPRRRWSLVLVHKAHTDRPRDTNRWVEGTNVASVYHVRRGNVDDIGRLARILSGNAVSLVLGGGGARGFAQVGVMRALEELGVPVDMCGGASIGGCMAFYLASGMTPDQIRDHLDRTWGRMLDYTLPLASVMAGRRINDRIEGDCLDWDLMDLWLPFFSVSTNITTSMPVIHRRGNGALAIRATSAIPGVLPPVPYHNGELLVDGGVLNNMPIDVMRELNPYGTVIAIDVSAPRGPSTNSDFGRHLSGWRLALDRLNPLRTAPKVPPISSMIMQSMVAGSGRAREDMLAANLADYYQNIHVRGVGMLQFDAVEKSVELGYCDSIGPLREWVESTDLKF